MQRFGLNQFNKFRDFIYKGYGIDFRAEKKELLRSKLAKLMRFQDIESYDEYFALLNLPGNKEILQRFLDEITVHKTDFFREKNHFDFISHKMDFILNKNSCIDKTKEIRVWSAGCSMGEEPYSLAITLSQCLPPAIKPKILATDISSKVVAHAIKGVYSSAISSAVETHLLAQYFKRTEEGYEVSEKIKDMITFRSFNLMDNFPFRKGLDMIFCRNVMIYFDITVQENIISKFYNSLNPGGLLFIGHSESLTGKRHSFKYLEPTIYLKA